MPKNTKFHSLLDPLPPPQQPISSAGAPSKGGAHVQVRPPPPPPSPSYVMARTNLSLLLVLLLLHFVTSSSKSDSDILLQFKDNLIFTHDPLSDWNPSKPPCSGDNSNWVGVLCNKGSVWGLKLENMGLEGPMDIESLKEMSNLRTMSFMHNNFDGSLPILKDLGAIKTLYLSHNKFSGEIAENAFDGLLSLKKLHLAHNGLSGQIPISLTILPRLMELMLEENEFEGEIPAFRQERLQLLNVSSNNLAGPIPSVLRKMNVSSFSGNKELCGQPLTSCSSSGKLSVATIVVIVIVVAAALAAITSAFAILHRRRKMPQPDDPTSMRSTQTHRKVGSADLERMEQGSPDHSSSHGNQIGKLTFVREDRERFDLPDLLKASAEILGGGVFGSTYKAALSIGSVVVVKRFRHMNNVGKEEFQEHMKRLGRLRHPNLLPIVAFYYRKEEKLLVADYINNVSLAVHLHGNHSRGQPCLDWPTRLKIVRGVARGLLHLYNNLQSLITPHGHLKSSNVLLNQSFDPILTDYGLVPVVNQEHAQDLMVAYKSPEYKQNGRITKKTDIWCLGMLILEILTGKFPTHCLQQGKVNETDLPTWTQSVVREEKVVEVFDREMGVSKNSEGEMIKLLKIGLNCCESDVENRWDVKEVVERIEEVREKDGDDDFYSTYASEGDMHSTRKLSDDFSYPI